MSLRRKLFWVWFGVTIVWWLFGIFGGDGALIVLKLHVGGWRAAYVHLTLTLVIALGVPLLVFLAGRAAFWIGDQFSKGHKVLKISDVVDLIDAREVPAVRGPYKKRQPTKEEIANMSEQELYDTFGTRYPKNSN
jgi:hypothetical protein